MTSHVDCPSCLQIAVRSATQAQLGTSTWNWRWSRSGATAQPWLLSVVHRQRRCGRHATPASCIRPRAWRPTAMPSRYSALAMRRLP